MNQLQVFDFQGNGVRTLLIENEPWFVLRDVCEVLEIGNPSQVKTRLQDGVISNEVITDSLGRRQSVTVINEDGLFDVILESRKKEAKLFRKWVTSDVLPKIRKHGVYMTPDTIEKFLTNPETIITIATNWKEEQTKRIAAEKMLQEQKPLVMFAESVQVSEDSILVNDLAKLLKQNGIEIGGVRLFKYLRENGYLMKQGSQYNMPTQRSMELGLFEVKVGTRQSSDGTIKITRTPKVTGKGQVYFINKFKGPEAV